MSKEIRPILFSGSMVRAILDGRKTQTRRVIKPQPQYAGLEKMVYTLRPFAPSSVKGTPAEGVIIEPEEKIWCHEDWIGNIVGEQGKCPYGVPGDSLWVREAFVDFCPMWNGQWCGCGSKKMIAETHLIAYRATKTPIVHNDAKLLPQKWKPSIHMPRWASRLTLQITNIHVEKVQEISEEDARAEGVEHWARDDYSWEGKDANLYHWFGRLWDTMNMKRGYSWESCPWVWVLEFEVVDE